LLSCRSSSLPLGVSTPLRNLNALSVYKAGQLNQRLNSSNKDQLLLVCIYFVFEHCMHKRKLDQMAETSADDTITQVVAKFSELKEGEYVF
jgi:hypothetical protein